MKRKSILIYISGICQLFTFSGTSYAIPTVGYAMELAYPYPTQDTALIARLSRIGFSGLWWIDDSKTVAESIYSESGMPIRLESLVADTTAPVEARLIAAEILSVMNKEAFFSAGKEVLADLYLDALLTNATGVMGEWAFNEGTEEIGSLGRQVLDLYPAGEKKLRALLADSNKVKFIRWFPGIEPRLIWCTECNWRIRDFAAIFLSLRNQIPIQFNPNDVGERDREITRLKALLPPLE